MYYINDTQVAKADVEAALISGLSNQQNPTIILRAAESIAIKEAVYIMDIANRNQFKVILAVRPN
jgi:biopolymer transport protein ExbD